MHVSGTSSASRDIDFQKRGLAGAGGSDGEEGSGVARLGTRKDEISTEEHVKPEPLFLDMCRKR